VGEGPGSGSESEHVRVGAGDRNKVSRVDSDVSSGGGSEGEAARGTALAEARPVVGDGADAVRVVGARTADGVVDGSVSELDFAVAAGDDGHGFADCNRNGEFEAGGDGRSFEGGGEGVHIVGAGGEAVGSDVQKRSGADHGAIRSGPAVHEGGIGGTGIGGAGDTQVGGFVLGDGKRLIGGGNDVRDSIEHLGERVVGGCRVA
jgi:hypothetical protein